MPAQSFGKRTEALAFPLLRATYKGWWSLTEPLGRFLEDMAMGQ